MEAGKKYNIAVGERVTIKDLTSNPMGMYLDLLDALGIEVQDQVRRARTKGANGHIKAVLQIAGITYAFVAHGKSVGIYSASELYRHSVSVNEEVEALRLVPPSAHHAHVQGVQQELASITPDCYTYEQTA